MADLSRIVNRLIPAGVSETPDFVVPPEYNALAIRFGVTNVTAANIVKHKTWKVEFHP